MPAPAGLLNYLHGALAATPVVLNQLVTEIEPNSQVWDSRPFADRFTLREAIAHLADWDEIFMERIIATRDTDCPFLPSVDEGVLCTERDYASSDVLKSLQLFSQRRESLITLVKSLDEASWDKKCHREFVGDLDMFQLASIIPNHDAYHLRQVAEYRKLLA